MLTSTASSQKLQYQDSIRTITIVIALPILPSGALLLVSGVKLSVRKGNGEFMNNPISKKVVFGFIGVAFAFFLVIFALGFPSYSKHHLFGSELGKVVKEYDKDKQVELFGDNEAYAMGLNAEDLPVFKDKFKAMAQLKKDCPDGLKYIKKLHKLRGNLSIFYWDWYATYSGYRYDDADEEIQPQFTKIEKFFDVYINSFKDPENEM